jgi:hypothetical protein
MLKKLSSSIKIKKVHLKTSRIPKFNENRWNRAGPNFKTTDFTVYCFKILEKIKVSKKYGKKTRSNSKVTSEEIFVKPSRLDW